MGLYNQSSVKPATIVLCNLYFILCNKKRIEII